ncbi:TonB-dependent receptor [Ramlibacter rhizophilus]|uniref:TonB-dependent receptor n=1 Tax=Ramlibacter rhizophilus TaxID=1781167 RepID=A0A4Z0BBN1_9BURK|nr:TonB-dependent receptor [Ramlibacter rhizophilus]TFY96552.1 TonB-dependent receptor [Ramlibacter rhizophilus]
MNLHFLRSAVGAAAGTLCLSAAAQGAGTLPDVTVTGNPLGSSQRVAPVERVEGTGLLLRGQGSLGGALDHLPGVSSTHFGPGVSRPILRGLDGDRIRILRNGAAQLDASSLSFDHAVPIDPLTVDRIEVLRGPAALLYGGTAIGGVVNAIDGRIPRSPLQGLTGRADASLATGRRERAGAVMLQAGTGNQVLHVDAFGRDNEDVRLPLALPCAGGVSDRLCNTAGEARGAALGGSTFFERGWLGASVSTHRKDYGSPADEAVRIGMRSDRYAIEGQWRPAPGWLENVQLQAAHTDYGHTEFEAGETGTVFATRGNELRLQARHRAFGPLSGVVGLQAEHTRFSALGDEAFAPASRTRQQAVFIHEELALDWGRLSLGARTERVRVASQGSPGVDRFLVGSREFQPTSYALGALWKLAPSWELTGQLAHSERAPRDYELFANGPHIATQAWEQGDATLGLERSNSAELALAWKQGPNEARLGAFAYRFSNYIALQTTGADREVEPGETLPEFAYRDVPARFHGLEASGNWRLRSGAPQLDIAWRADQVRATDRSTGEPLPRIAPVRAGAALVLKRGEWGGRLGFDHAARQDRVPTGAAAVAGYTTWHAALTREQAVGQGQLLWYARLDNLTDTVARPATSFLTQTAPERALLAGRSLRVGVRAEF